jgi:hypothetical protein
MKRPHSSISTAIQSTSVINSGAGKILTLKDKRDKIIEYAKWCLPIQHKLLLYHKHLNLINNCDEHTADSNVPGYLDIDIEGYSFLGLTAMSFTMKYHNDQNIDRNKYYIYQSLSYAEKKYFTKIFSMLGFGATRKDMEIVPIEKYERCLAKFYPLYYANKNNMLCFSQIPHELIKKITLLTFAIEEPLF